MLRTESAHYSKCQLCHFPGANALSILQFGVFLGGNHGGSSSDLNLPHSGLGLLAP